MTVDFSGMVATRAGAPVALRSGEWTLLARLWGAMGKVCHRDDLLSEVFGMECSRTLDTTVATLRRKLGWSAAGGPLVTVPKFGYRLDVQGVERHG